MNIYNIIGALLFVVLFIGAVVFTAYCKGLVVALVLWVSIIITSALILLAGYLVTR